MAVEIGTGGAVVVIVVVVCVAVMMVEVAWALSARANLRCRP